jgi:hypothetical protein
MWRRAALRLMIGTGCLRLLVSCDDLSKSWPSELVNKPTTLCEIGCTSSSGCLSCAEGSKRCDDGLTVRRCSAGCWEKAESCVPPGGCVVPPGGSARCADSLDDCAAIRDAYEEALRQADITIVRSGSPSLAAGAYNAACSDADCVMDPGHCAAGLDTCWLLGRPAPEIGRLASLHQALGCPPVLECNCPPAVVATCESGVNGAPAWQNGSISATNACIVH